MSRGLGDVYKRQVESSSNLISFLDFAWNKNKTLVRNFELLKATLFMRGFNIAFNAVLIEFLILIKLVLTS